MDGLQQISNAMRELREGQGLGAVQQGRRINVTIGKHSIVLSYPGIRVWPQVVCEVITRGHGQLAASLLLIRGLPLLPPAWLHAAFAAAAAAADSASTLRLTALALAYAHATIDGQRGSKRARRSTVAPTSSRATTAGRRGSAGGRTDRKDASEGGVDVPRLLARFVEVIKPVADEAAGVHARLLRRLDKLAGEAGRALPALESVLYDDAAVCWLVGGVTGSAAAAPAPRKRVRRGRGGGGDAPDSCINAVLALVRCLPAVVVAVDSTYRRVRSAIAASVGTSSLFGGRASARAASMSAPTLQTELAWVAAQPATPCAAAARECLLALLPPAAVSGGAPAPCPDAAQLGDAPAPPTLAERAREPARRNPRRAAAASWAAHAVQAAGPGVGEGPAPAATSAADGRDVAEPSMAAPAEPSVAPPGCNIDATATTAALPVVGSREATALLRDIVAKPVLALTVEGLASGQRALALVQAGAEVAGVTIVAWALGALQQNGERVPVQVGMPPRSESTCFTDYGHSSIGTAAWEAQVQRLDAVFGQLLSAALARGAVADAHDVRFALVNSLWWAVKRMLAAGVFDSNTPLQGADVDVTPMLLCLSWNCGLKVPLECTRRTVVALIDAGADLSAFHSDACDCGANERYFVGRGWHLDCCMLRCVCGGDEAFLRALLSAGAPRRWLSRVFGCFFLAMSGVTRMPKPPPALPLAVMRAGVDLDCTLKTHSTPFLTALAPAGSQQRGLRWLNPLRECMAEMKAAGEMWRGGTLAHTWRILSPIDPAGCRLAPNLRYDALTWLPSMVRKIARAALLGMARVASKAEAGGPAGVRVALDSDCQMQILELALGAPLALIKEVACFRLPHSITQ